MNKRSKKKQYWSGFLIVLLVINSLMLGMNYSLSKSNSDIGVVKSIHAMIAGKDEDTYDVELEPFITNLKPIIKNSNSYISVTFAISVKGEKAADDFKLKSASARDSIIAFLNEQSMVDLLVHDDKDVNERDYLKGYIKESLDGLYEDEGSPIEEVFVVDLVLQ